MVQVQLRGQPFDLAVVSQTLEHLYDPLLSLLNIKHKMRYTALAPSLSYREKYRLTLLACFYFFWSQAGGGSLYVNAGGEPATHDTLSLSPLQPPRLGSAFDPGFHTSCAHRPKVFIYLGIKPKLMLCYDPNTGWLRNSGDRPVG